MSPICGSDPSVSITYKGYFSSGTIINPLIDYLSVSSTSGAITIKNTAPLGSQIITVRGSVLNVQSV
jgi:hypothetical protein